MPSLDNIGYLDALVRRTFTGNLREHRKDRAK